MRTDSSLRGVSSWRGGKVETLLGMCGGVLFEGMPGKGLGERKGAERASVLL